MERIKPFDTKKVLAVYIVCNALTIITIIGSIISTVNNGSLGKLFEHIGLCIAAIFVYNMPLILRMKFKLHIPSFLQITVTVFAIAHFVAGEIFRFYDYSLLFDKILHTTSGIVFGICGFSLINGLNNAEKPLLNLSPFFVALFSFCFALAIGYVWELYEFSMDSIFGMNMQRWRDGFYKTVIDGEERFISDYGQGNGLIDSMGDMIVNMVGAIVISLLGYIWLKRKSKKMNIILIQPISAQMKSKAAKTQQNERENALETVSQTAVETAENAVEIKAETGGEQSSDTDTENN